MRELAAVLAGGLLGTGVRLLTDVLIPHGDTDFPLSTLLVNVVGSFLLGLLVSRLWTHAPSWMKAGLGAGLIGSFTTFSAVMVSLVAQGVHGAWLLAIGYLVASLVLGLGTAALGLHIGRARPWRSDAPIDWVDE